MRNRPEARLEKAVLDACGALPGVILMVNVVKTIPSPFGPGWLTFGLGEGTPDLVGTVDGRFVGLELKVPGKKSKPHQREVAEAWRLFGGFVAEVHSPEEALGAIIRARIVDGINPVNGCIAWRHAA